MIYTPEKLPVDDNRSLADLMKDEGTWPNNFVLARAFQMIDEAHAEIKALKLNVEILQGRRLVPSVFQEKWRDGTLTEADTLPSMSFYPRDLKA